MTVTSVGAMNNRLQALSSDEKPLTVDDGAELHIIDTGEQYIFHDGAWEPDRRLIYALNVI